MKFKPFFSITLTLGVVVSLLHIATFNRPQLEGDELVYLNLSNKVSLSLENYHTMDVPGVNEFPAKIYRAPYFIHPPLYPAILKTLSLLGNRAFLGLIFNGFVHFACCLLVLFGVFQITADLKHSAFGAILTAICPIMTAASIKLHIDALAGLLCLATFFSLFFINEKKSSLYAFLPGLLFGLALNTKLTVFAITPVYCISVYLAICALENKTKKRMIFAGIALTVPAMMIAPHVFHLLKNYQSLFPYQLLQHDRPDNEFLKRILSRTRVSGVINLITLTPLAVLLFTPSFYKEFWKGLGGLSGKKSKWSIIFLINLVVPVLGVFYGTERYWALFLPFLYFSVSIFFFEKKWLDNKNITYAVYVCLFLMICSSFFQGVVQPQNDLIYPSIFLMIPSLMPYYL